MARIAVAGYVVRHPLAGNVWAHLQYVLGLSRLGHDVWFVEEAGWENSCYDPSRGEMTSDPASGTRVLDAVLAKFGLGDRWAYRDWSGRWHGAREEVALAAIADADLFLDVGGVSHFPEMAAARTRAYVDMDPVFTQLGSFGHARLREYDVHFTYGANIGTAASAVPTCGFEWKPLRPPVVLDLWARGNDPGRPQARTAWSTVASWGAYGALERDGEVYGQKDVEFLRFIDVPRLAGVDVEIATAGPDVPVDRLAAHGWRVVDPLAVSRDPWAYRDFVAASRGEFSVAKSGYVKGRAGWFSDRTASYLACGRPAVVQDTGVHGELAEGRGLVLFTTPAEAVAALRAVDADIEGHARDALRLARAHFDAGMVLTRLLADAGV